MLVLIVLALAVMLVVAAILLLSNKKREATNILDSDEMLFFSRDDYCQVELLPAENREYIVVIIERINRFAQKQFDGNGYHDIISIKEHRFPLSFRNIHFKDLEAVFALYGMERQTEVTTAYGAHRRTKCINTIGYGKSYSGIFFNFEGGVVQHIWLTNAFNLDREKLLDVLHEVGISWDLLLVDWGKKMVVDLRRKSEVRDYLSRL